MATGPIETHLHRSFNWENGAPGPREGQRGRSARCGNGLFAQCVRLRSEINPHSACREDAEAVAALIEEQVPQLKGKIEINDIGTLIGSHTGPGTVALFFMGDKRVD